MHTSWLYFYWILHTCMFVFTWICQCVYTLVCMHVEARGWHWQASLFALQFIFLRVLKYFYLCIYSFICFCVYVDAHICGKLCVWGQRTTCRNLFSFYYVGSRDQTQAWQQTPLPTELFCKPPPPHPEFLKWGLSLTCISLLWLHWLFGSLKHSPISTFLP